MSWILPPKLEATNPDPDSCSYVHFVNESSRCQFVTSNEDCNSGSGFLPYLTFVYCDLQGLPILAIAILGLWLLALFITLGISADDFFCPNLAKIAKTLK